MSRHGEGPESEEEMEPFDGVHCDLCGGWPVVAGTQLCKACWWDAYDDRVCAECGASPVVEGTARGPYWSGEQGLCRRCLADDDTPPEPDEGA